MNNLNEIKILSLNVEFYNRITSKSSLYSFGTSLSNLNPDLICLQEDSYKENNWILNYSRIIVYPSNYCTNSIWCKNTKLNLIKDTISFPLPPSNPQRYCVCVNYDGIIIANTHLTGGRYDDINFKYITNIKDKQIQHIIDKTNPLIILGDFNGDEPKSERTHKSLTNYHFFNKLNKIDKKIFLEFWSGGHSILKDNNYQNVFNHFDEIFTTSIFNTNPDHIYYKKENISFQDLEIIDTITNNYTDHNALLVTFNY